MERAAVIVAGIGFRAGADVGQLRAALRLAEAQGQCRATVLATAASKVLAPQMQSLARTLDLPLRSMDVAGMDTPTQSPAVQARFDTGSVAEAAALAAAGPGGRLIVRRVVCEGGMATAALAEGPGR